MPLKDNSDFRNELIDLVNKYDVGTVDEVAADLIISILDAIIPVVNTVPKHMTPE